MSGALPSCLKARDILCKSGTRASPYKFTIQRKEAMQFPLSKANPKQEMANLLLRTFLSSPTLRYLS